MGNLIEEYEYHNAFLSGKKQILKATIAELEKSLDETEHAIAQMRYESPAYDEGRRAGYQQAYDLLKSEGLDIPADLIHSRLISRL